MKIRVLLADDHAIVRHGLRSLLELSGMQVVAEAGDGREAVRLVESLAPDVAIFDVSMPIMNGIDATALLHERGSRTRIVILSMHSGSEHTHRAFAAGASGYLLKGSASDEVVAAVRAVVAGGQYVRKDLTLRNDGPTPLESLSPRERQVLQLVVEGHSSAEVAAMVNLSPKSVDTYRSRLMRKLGVTDVVGLVKFAVENGLTPGA